MVNETNKYAKSKGPEPKWGDTTFSEMKDYIAFQIVVGIISVPNQIIFFMKDNFFYSAGIREFITRDRLD